MSRSLLQIILDRDGEKKKKSEERAEKRRLKLKEMEENGEKDPYELGQILIGKNDEGKYQFFHVIGFISTEYPTIVLLHRITKNEEVVKSTIEEYHAKVTPNLDSADKQDPIPEDDLRGMKKKDIETLIDNKFYLRAEANYIHKTYTVMFEGLRYILQEYNINESYIEITVWENFKEKKEEPKPVRVPKRRELREMYKWMRVGKDNYDPTIDPMSSSTDEEEKERQRRLAEEY